MKTQNDNIECACFCHQSKYFQRLARKRGFKDLMECQHCTDTKEDKGSESETFEDWEKIEKELTPVMENKVASVIGEDGLTVWDFAELRDSLIDFIHQQRQQVKDKTIRLVARKIKIELIKKERIKSNTPQQIANGAKLRVLHELLHELKQPTDRK